MKYFYHTQELLYPHPMRNKDFWTRFGYPLRGKSYDGYSKFVGYAPGATKDGQELPVTRIINYKKNPSLHKCDARCRHAKGNNCECSCGGQFHGFGG